MNDGVLWTGVEVCVVACDMQGGSRQIRPMYSNHLGRKESGIAHLETFKLEGFNKYPKTLIEKRTMSYL